MVTRHQLLLAEFEHKVLECIVVPRSADRVPGFSPFVIHKSMDQHSLVSALATLQERQEQPN